MRRQIIAVTVALGLVLAPAAAASAAPAADTQAKLALPDVTVMPDGTPFTTVIALRVPATVPSFAFVIDLRAAQGVVDIAGENPEGYFHCVTTVTTLTCANKGGNNAAAMTVTLTAHTGAVAGDVASVPVRAVVDGTTVASGNWHFTVADRVNLAAGPDPGPVKAKIGDTVPLPLTVANIGARPATGAVVLISKDEVLRPTKRYRNCWYGVYSDGSVACEFDDTLAPGKIYRPVEPFNVHLGTDVWSPSYRFATIWWMTPHDWTEIQKVFQEEGLPVGHRGNGGTLGLEVAPDAARRATPPQTDPDDDDNLVGFRLDLRSLNRSHFSAVGDTATGTVGSTVKIQVGLRNHGPAVLLNDRGSLYSNVIFAIKMPPGTTVVKIPAECILVRDYDPEPIPPGARPAVGEYSCGRNGAFQPRTSRIWEFTLRLDKVEQRAKGEVFTQLKNTLVGSPTDPAPAADVAPIIITAKAASSGDGGSGGGLPITGGNSGTLALAGLLMILVGAGARFLSGPSRKSFGG